MKTLFAAIAVMFVPAIASCQDLVPITTLGTPVAEHADRTVGWDGHVNFVQWAGDWIVCAGRSGFVRCFDPKEKQPTWSAQLAGEVADLTVAPTNDRVYVSIRPSATLGDHGIRELRLSDGTKSNALSTNLTNRIAWIPMANQLVATTFSREYAENGLLYDARSLKKVGTMKCDGFVTDITTVGQFIVTLSNRNNIRIWDRNAGKEIFKIGEDEEVGADSPFFSNAMFDGKRTLVFTIDNSWGKGTVHVHDIVADKETARFSSRSGHVVMDVDFARGRIALTGTNRGLTIVDLAGKQIANKDSVALQRNVALNFSDDGKRLAIGSWDNSVRVFEVRESEAR